MKIEDQVISLELAKRLKALNLKQESLFYWVETPIITPPQWELMRSVDLQNAYKGQNFYSAFTVGELGEMLPRTINTDKWSGKLDLPHKTNGKWLFSLPVIPIIEYKQADLEPTCANTEANARAKMLIYLIENKLI